MFNTAAVTNYCFTNVKLSDYRGKYVVLMFYPNNFSQMSTTEIIQYSDRVKDFRDLNCELMLCSGESKYSNMEYMKKDRKAGGVSQIVVPMISDFDHSLATRYGCLIPKADGSSPTGECLRATYIIDPKGILRHMSIYDLPIGRDVNETLRTLRAVHYTDSHPKEICPAGWNNPSNPTMPTEYTMSTLPKDTTDKAAKTLSL